MQLFHGTDSRSASNILKNGIDLSRGDRSVDYGPGFYSTPNLRYARRRAESVTLMRGGKAAKLHPVVLVFEFQPPDENGGLRRLCFETPSIDWKMFILYNRCIPLGYCMQEYHISNLKGEFDIVEGLPADAGVSNIVTALVNGRISLEEALQKIGLSGDPDWGDMQISFHTERAISCIRDLRIYGGNR